MKASQAVLEALRAEGVEYTFGVVRGATRGDRRRREGRPGVERSERDRGSGRRTLPGAGAHATGCGPALKRSGRSSA